MLAVDEVVAVDVHGSCRHARGGLCPEGGLQLVPDQQRGGHGGHVGADDVDVVAVAQPPQPHQHQQQRLAWGEDRQRQSVLIMIKVMVMMVMMVMMMVMMIKGT